LIQKKHGQKKLTWNKYKKLKKSNNNNYFIKMEPVITRIEKKTRTTQPSAYNNFMTDEIPRVKKENPGITHREAFKLAASRWKDSPMNVKKPKEEKKTKEEKKAEVKEGEEKTEKVTEKVKKMKIVDETKKLEKPPKSPTPYNTYMSTEIGNVKKENPGMGHREAFKIAASRWATAPENPKNKTE